MFKPARLDAKKSLGQHFLTSDVVPRWLCDAAELQPGEIVLEIGPGTGVLTAELLRRGVTVIGLEADARAIDVLQETFATEIAAGTLRLEHTDVRQLDLTTIEGLVDHGFKVVANIPYYLSGFLFRTILESACQPTTIVFLVQKEVAKRVAEGNRPDEKQSLLSLSVAAYGTARYVKTVSKGHFTPPPKVDSGIIAITDINRDRFTHVPTDFFFELLHLGFGQKRKRLLGNLRRRFATAEITHTFSTIGLSETVRAEDIPIDMWLQLATHLYTQH